MIGVLRYQPSCAAALGMGNQDGIFSGHLIDLIDGCGNSLCHHVAVKVSAHIGGHASIRSHLAEELIYRFVIIWELGTFVGNRLSIFPTSDTELGVPALIQGLGADVSAHGSGTCLTAARLIDQEYAVSFSQEHIGPALTSVRCCHPAHTGLTITMQEYHRKASFILRNLIKYIGVVYVGCLSGSGFFPLIFRIEGSIGSNGCTACCKNTLLFDDQSAICILFCGILGFCVFLGSCFFYTAFCLRCLGGCLGCASRTAAASGSKHCTGKGNCR